MTKTFDEFVREAKKTNNELIQGMYQSFLGIDLNIDLLWETGEPIKESEIQTGDLLYFKMSETEKRVAIAYTNTKFVHYTNEGVKESTLTNDYWAARFIGVRRTELKLLNIYKV
ncbi:C40 family peptidase [Paenibacillus amylolyticus]|uniref:C40 family peptidase n=1 Tax=Paenibacillus amylolyticus TaxID=1451 RepID=UPI003D804DFE